MLIDRDLRAFVRGDWGAVADDFDSAHFSAHSGAGGMLRLEFPTLAAYRESWLAQSAELTAGADLAHLEKQLAAIQWVERIDLAEDKALAVKVFSGELDLAEGMRSSFRWKTYYFLRFDVERERWLITGFVGYLPSEGTME